MSIKITRAQRIATVGKYHRTWAALIEKMPEEIKAACTARQIAAIADAMRAQYEAGHSAGYADATA